MKQKHEAAAALLVTPADLVTARHKEVWFLGLSWEHAKRRALNLAPLYIKTPIEHQIWNRARDALKKKKEALKKFNSRAVKTAIRKGKPKKPSPATPEVLGSDDDNEGHCQEDDYIAANDNIVKCGASAHKLDGLVHVMTSESTEEAL